MLLRKLSRLGLRLTCLGLCLMTLLGSAQSANALSPVTRSVIPADTASYVRSGASRSSYIIGQIPNQHKLTVLDTVGEFYKIDCYDMTGYILREQVVRKNEEYYVNCKIKSPETLTIEFCSITEAWDFQRSIMDLAKKQLGYPYVYGGTRPGGFDCSGFIYYLYGQHGYTLHRGSSGQLQDGIIVSRENMLPGDLILFRDPGETYPTSHIGIYAGGGEFIHASCSKGITYSSLDDPYYALRFLCVRRVVNFHNIPTSSVRGRTALQIASGLR